MDSKFGHLQVVHSFWKISTSSDQKLLNNLKRWEYKCTHSCVEKHKGDQQWTVDLQLLEKVWRDKRTLVHPSGNGRLYSHVERELIVLISLSTCLLYE